MSQPYEPSHFDPENPERVAIECIEHGAESLLLDAPSLPPEFFDLSTRVVGTLLNKLTIYEIRMAVVDPLPSTRSESFKAFVREANSGRRFRFMADRDEALAWLAQAEEMDVP